MSELEEKFKGTEFQELACLIDCVGEEVGHLSKAGHISLFDDFPEELRYELLRLGASINDYVFWIHKYKDTKLIACLEIETGVSSYGKTPKEAMKNYWRGVFG